VNSGRRSWACGCRPPIRFNDIADSDPAALFGHVAAALDRLDFAYLHVVEPATPIGPGRGRGRTDASSARAGAGR